MLRASFAVLICIAFASLTSGAPERAAPHPLTNLPKAGEIKTGYFFPDFPTKKFPAGAPVKLVLGIHNEAAEAYNITAILGSVNSVTDFKLYVQNFTNQVYMQNLEPGGELTVEYTFQTYPQLPARDFIMALTLFYARPSGEYLSTTFFNQTIEIVEKKQFIDFDLIFMYLILAGLLAGLGWLAVPYLPSFGSAKKKGPKKSASVTRTAPITSEEKAAEDDEWIRGTPYDAFRRRKSAEKDGMTKRSDSASKKAAAAAARK